jgi:hypothetical protein
MVGWQIIQKSGDKQQLKNAIHKTKDSATRTPLKSSMTSNATHG